MENSTTILTATHNAPTKSFFSKRLVKLSLPFITLFLLALTIGFAGHWFLAATIFLLGSVSLYIHRIVKQMYSIDWLSDETGVDLQDIINDLEGRK